MAVTLQPGCDCPMESRIQALFRLNTNLVTLFSSMATGFVGTRVTMIGDGCGCTEAQILAAINANVVEFGLNFTGGGGSGSEVAMPASTAAAGAAGEYALDGTKRADYVTGTGWLFIDGYQI